MNLGEAKRRALILMREWTIDGSVVPAMDNADYLKSMNDLANMAQNEIAQRRKIRAVYKPADYTPTVFGDYYRYSMPSEFIGLERVLAYDTDGRIDLNPTHAWLGRDILIPQDTDYTYEVHYYKMPTQIQVDPNDEDAYDDTEFEVDPDVQDLIPFYMAAQCLMDEDAGLATLKLNEYYARLEQIAQIDPMQRTIIDVNGW